jgi:hypothetical protein
VRDPERFAARIDGVCRFLVLVVSALGLGFVVQAPPAFAGGTQLVVAAVAGQIWVTTGFDVVKLDANTGRVERRNTTRYVAPMDIGVSDGSVWVSSVANGFTSGAVTRIPSEAGRLAQPLVFPSRPVLALAVGGGTTWALVGPWTSLELAAIDQATNKVTLTPIRAVGWIAADNTGETPGLFGVTSTSGEVIRFASNGALAWTASTDRIESPVVVGVGSVWAASRTGLYRLNALTGQVQARIPVRDAAAELAVGGGYVWMVSFRETTTGEVYVLSKVDPRTARIVKQTKIGGPVGNISFGSGALWTGRAAPTVTVIRIDPITLKARVFAKNLETAQP